MASLNPYAPVYLPGVEGTPAPNLFLSPSSSAYGYPSMEILPSSMYPIPWGFPSAEIPFISSVVPASISQLPVYLYYYCQYQHGMEMFSSEIRWSVPYLVPPEICFPFYPTFPIPQEALLAPQPAWQPPRYSLQTGTLEVPPTPLMRNQLPCGSQTQKAVVLRKRRVKVGPRWRVRMDSKGGGDAAGGRSAAGVTRRVRRGPKRKQYRGLRSLWVPKLRCYRKKSPQEAKLYEQFQFKTDGVLEGRGGTLAGVEDGDTRTTVMIKNIPNKLRKDALLRHLDTHCIEENRKAALHEQQDHLPTVPSQFNFFYLPIDFGTGSNLGYAFVNFTTAAAAKRLYHAMHNSTWLFVGSKKVCEITYARIQGLPALLKHFRSTAFPCDCPDVLPIYFVPCRDGICQGQCHYVGRLIPQHSA